MSSDLTNLLPPERIRAFRRSYYMRLGALAVLALAVLAVVHGILLAPAYIYLNDAATLEEAHLSQINANLASGGEGQMNARLGKLESDAGRLVAVASSTSATRVIRAVLGVPRTGITLIGFTYHAPSPVGRVTITGMATTRENLRQYVLALSALPFAKSADLPLSAYAKESDIPFTITLTGSLAP